MEATQATAHAYEAGDNRPTIDVEQEQLWGLDPAENQALNLSYDQIKA